ncbi:MAG TPA: 2-C-methyl-D-erythritol 2,4-cyclodiphosphate synthase [Candidatus Limnocylindria bacterium]|nr:2-C-methyl-D-erythritol 2,4-cyclodiphosphate synthase [Candidatus Limnocylindria bacterium]
MQAVVADVVIVAAGRSERMGGRDKLTADLAGRPVLAWSVAALAASPLVERIALVRSATVAAQPRETWLPDKVIAIVAGGARRQDSVVNGIRALEAAPMPRGGSDASTDPLAGPVRVVLIHDGARPIVSAALIERVARAAAEHGAAIPGLPIAETMKRVDGGLVGETIDRTGAVIAQTPQGIRWDVLRQALASAARDATGAAELTDEAALLQAAGVPVHVVAGEPGNRKITVAEDLTLAAAALTAGGATRTGIGSDGHPFGPGAGLRLGGIKIPNAPRLHGHSDGDAALHAIAGALLGAAALGDLGTLHPADARTPRGIASADLLRDVRARLADVGWQPRAVDVTIRAGRPRLGSHLPAMCEAIAALLELPVEKVSVKAATGNLSGDAGAGRTIEAEAIASIGRIGADE